MVCALFRLTVGVFTPSKHVPLMWCAPQGRAIAYMPIEKSRAEQCPHPHRGKGALLLSATLQVSLENEVICPSGHLYTDCNYELTEQIIQQTTQQRTTERR